MLSATFIARLTLAVWAAGAFAQGPVRPSQKAKPAQDAKPPADKPAEPPPDPTKDPMKDPAKDITKDPAKDPDKDPSKNPDPAKPAEAGADEPAVEAPDYTGPAILSRGFAVHTPSLPTQERFRPFIGVAAIYDSGLTGPFIQGGRLVGSSSNGVDLNLGITGRHYRRRDVIELEYRGHYYRYSSNTQYNGQDHALNVGYSRVLSPHLTVNLRETAGLYSNNYSVLNSTSIADTSVANMTLAVSPNTESFDNRTTFSSSQGSMVYQKSMRLSISMGGSYFLTSRNSRFLADVHGFQTNADISYRLTKRSTTGVFYAHSGYAYKKAFGSSSIDSVGLSYSYAVSKTIEVSTRFGGSRVENLGLLTVPLNPLVAAVLGQMVGTQKTYGVTLAPDFSGTLNKRAQHSKYGINFSEGISPGNGLYLTSRSQSESIFYDYTGLRRYGFGLGAGRDVLSSVNSLPGHYASYYGRLSVSHVLPKHWHSVFSFDYRKLAFSAIGYGRNEYRISLGFDYSPGEGPLKFW